MLFRNLSLLVLASIIFSCNRPGKVLLITGGHSYDTLEFHDVFQGMDGFSVEAVNHPEASLTLASLDKGDFDLIAFYDFIPGMDPSDSSIYLRLTELGFPMLFLHHSICSMQEWEGYARMVGGKYIMPNYSKDTLSWSDYRHDVELGIRVVAPEHPICKGIGDFSIHDEAYSNLRVEGNVEILLRSDHPDCHPEVGWTHMAGNSRVVYLIFGHDRHSYGNENFQQLISNSFNWLSQ